jgi:collagenase-like PrtC family protease
VPKVELLSPAGGWDSLKAAVSEGADAVYLGVGQFNARRRAENFSQEGLPAAVGFCHDAGVRCYLAANTLVKNAELGGYFRLLEAAYAAGADAVIVQELSFVKPIKAAFPDLGVHVSTQAGAFNAYYETLLAGADRVILPRELTLNQVREFRERAGIPVEVFVQGALCFCVGGQCLMSSFLGGRSGNRGLCAQPCRKMYGGAFRLSTRDLCLLRKLPQIVDAGVASLKIEGRLRSPEYVGAATAVYRRALDSIEAGAFSVDEDAFLDLELAFSREYTLGGMFREYDVVSPLESGKRGVHIGKLGKDQAIRLGVGLKVGDGIGVITKNGSHGDIVRKIERAGCQVRSAERGQTVSLDINAHEGDDLYLTSGQERRRPYAVRGRRRLLLQRSRRRFQAPAPRAAGFETVRLLVRAYSARGARDAVAAGAWKAYYDVFAKDYPREDAIVRPYVPRCLTQWEADEAVDALEDIGADSALCADAGVACRLAGQAVYLDVSCNAYNDMDVGFYNGLNMVPVVSPELTFGELERFHDKRFAVYAHGRVPLMTSRYDLDGGSLDDELGYVFPVRKGRGQTEVLNSVPLGLFGEVARLRDAGIVEFLLDLEEDVAGTISLYRKALSGERIQRPEGYTYGHFRDGVE